MWYGLFDAITGELLSISSVAPVLTEGRGVYSQEEDPRSSLWGWDNVNRMWHATQQLPSPLTKVEFKERFTQGERIAIRQAAENVPELYDFMDLLNSADDVRLDDPRTMNGVNLLEEGNIIGAGRAQEILSWQ